MSSPAVTRLATAAPEFIIEATTNELADWIAYFEPDALLMTGETPARNARRRLHRERYTAPPIYDPADDTQPGPHQVGDGTVVVVSSLADLAGFTETEAGQDPASSTYIVSDLLEITVDTTTLSTTIHGLTEYVNALQPAQLDGDYTHVSTQLPTGYHHEWEGLSVIGCGDEAGTHGASLSAIDCTPNGRVTTQTLRRDTLGIRALDQVGSKRAKQLRRTGYRTRDQIADAKIRDLADIDGIGRSAAERITDSARAQTNGEVIGHGHTPLPDGDPIFLDIETNGLSPTITWLIGVLDGGPRDGRFTAFVQRDPSNPGGALADFMRWYTSTAHGRPLVAYGGVNFDFRVIHDHLREYCPTFTADWARTFQFDPYRWAVTDGNATLPGRTNRLEDVASALGYDRRGPRLTGAAVARAYQQWMTDATPASEPAWNDMKAYCEDDVRALATVYSALKTTASTGTQARPARTPTTTQRSLTDW